MEYKMCGQRKALKNNHLHKYFKVSELTRFGLGLVQTSHELINSGTVKLFLQYEVIQSGS